MSLTILDKIKAYKLQEVAADKALKPLTEIESEAREASPPRGFATALIQAASAGYGLIAEVKKASPSKGLIPRVFRVQNRFCRQRERRPTCRYCAKISCMTPIRLPRRGLWARIVF